MSDRGAPKAGSRRAVIAWCFYDWANSAFPTVITTFVFAAYFTRAVAESPVAGTAQWGRALSIAAIVVALLSPVLGAIADKLGRRKPWLAVFTAICVVATGLMWFVEPSSDKVLLALGLLVAATIAFDFGMVFYNAMLPGLTARERLGRISGWGWGLGYAGGILCLSIALLGFVQTGAPWLGLDREAAEHVRATTLLVACWFAAFSLPLFLFTPDQKASGLSFGEAARAGLATLGETLRNVRRYGTIVRFLIAHMIYINGLTTLFAFAGIYAAGTFGMELADIITFGIALNLTAGAGAIAFAWVDDWIGAKFTVVISLVALIVFGGILVLVPNTTWLWVFGLMLGIFVGPVQAASRSLMARMAPKSLETEMFGLLALSGKASAFIGPFVLAMATEHWDSQRPGMATILLFFVVGLAILWPLAEPRSKGS
jgi:UMF1 family MFS transporter